MSQVMSLSYFPFLLLHTAIEGAKPRDALPCLLPIAAHETVAERLEPCFEDQVERRFHRAPKTGDSGFAEHPGESAFAGLRPKHHSAAMGNRVGAADRRLGCVVYSGHRRD